MQRQSRDGHATPRGTSFSIAFSEPVQRAKPKPKATGSFRFLRKDEGHRVHNAHAGVDKMTPVSQKQRNESAALRAAIAEDMRRRQGDPFAAADVAIPKRAPPPSRKAADIEHEEVQRRSASIDDHASAEHSSANVSDEKMGAKERAPSRMTQSVSTSLKQMPPNRHDGAPHHTATLDAAEDADDHSEEDSDSVDEERAPAKDQDISRPTQRELRDQGRSVMPQRLTAGRHQLLRTHLRARDPDAAMFEAEELWGPARAAPARAPSSGPTRATNRHNFFRPERREAELVDSYEEQLIMELEEERRSCAQEKKHYLRLKLQLEKERQRFESFKDEVEVQLEQERADMVRLVEDEKRALKKQQRQLDEQRRNMATSATAEKESVKRLQHENEQLREQLDQATAELREHERSMKAEIARLKRDVSSLTSRNTELLEMVRASQIDAVTRAADMNEGGTATDAAGGSVAQSPQQDRHAQKVSTHVLSVGLRQQQQQQALRDEERRPERERAATVAVASTPAPSDAGGTDLLDEEYERQQELDSQRRAAREKVARGIEERMAQEERARAERLRREQEKILERRKQVAPASSRVDENPALLHKDADKERIGLQHQQQQPQVQAQMQERAASSRRPPTVDELIADTEPAPPEDFPGDHIIAKSDANSNGKREHLYRSGKREVFYSNGTRKVILKSGVVTLYFSNGDIKRTFPSGKSAYTYAASQTIHTTLADGNQIFQFLAEEQTERHHPDGTKEILYPDGIYKVIFPDQSEEVVYPDGTVQCGGSDVD